MVHGNAARNAQVRDAILVKQVGEREWQVLLVPVELLAQRLKNLFLGVGTGQSRSHIAEGLHAALPDQTVRFLSHDA